MFLYIEDIILIKHMVFKDSNRIDFGPNGRPALIINASPEFLYYLSLSSRLPKNKNPYQHYQLNNNGIALKKNSYINLRNIYKIPTLGYPVVDCITDKVFYKVLTSFKFYQEKFFTDSLYPEIKDETEDLIRTLKRK